MGACMQAGAVKALALPLIVLSRALMPNQPPSVLISLHHVYISIRRTPSKHKTLAHKHYIDTPA